MRTHIEHYESGWSGIRLGLRAHEIEPLIEALRNLAQSGNDGHFHFMSQANADATPPAIIDMEVYLLGSSGTDNMWPTYGGPLPPEMR